MSAAWKRFMAMPILLRLLTAGGLCVGLMLISTLLPHSVVRIMGRPVPSQGWWTSGAGPTMLIVAGLFLSASVMMILRARHARLAYILACIAISISIPYVVDVSGGSTASLPKFSLTLNWLLTFAIGLYLYFSRGSRDYFRPVA